MIVVTAVGFGVTRVITPDRSCPTPAEHADWSVARRWDESLLDAIRRALPNPPVHARNLFHTSVAMWDAWAAYDPTANGYIYTAKEQAGDVAAARDEAISYAAYRVLSARFIKAVGGADSLAEFADVMDTLCYPVTVNTTEGDTPAAVGNRIAAAVLAYGLEDGSNQANGYAAPDYAPVNDPLVVNKPGTTMKDPNRWQPLQLEKMISQNGIPVENGVQQAVGPHWGHVLGFGIPDGGSAGVPMDPGPPPLLGGTPEQDQAYKDQAVEIVRRSSLLDAASDETIDISPASFGGNTLGTNDGHGPPGQPGDRPAVRAGPRQGRRLLPRAHRVLGGRPEVRDAARPLERHHQRGRRRARARRPEDRRAGGRGRPAAVGCQGVPRAQRRGPRRRHRARGVSRATTTPCARSR